MADDKSQQGESTEATEDLDEAVADASSDTLKTNTEAEADPQNTEGEGGAGS